MTEHNVTVEKDKKEEEKQAKRTDQVFLSKLGKQVKLRKYDEMEKEKKQTNKSENKGTVMFPYSRGISERIQRAMRVYLILEHPKNKVEQNNKCNIVYEIPCHTCSYGYGSRIILDPYGSLGMVHPPPPPILSTPNVIGVKFIY